jgi:hypothetical protein
LYLTAFENGNNNKVIRVMVPSPTNTNNKKTLYLILLIIIYLLDFVDLSILKL